MTSLQDLRVAVFGPGLLGGSLLYDARAAGAAELRVWARRDNALDGVRQAGLADFASTDAAAVAAGADVLILCVPVGGMTDLAQQISGAPVGAGAVFTDVGSVKGMVMREVAPVFAAVGREFIGSHPMAGSEKTGFEAARAGLYKDAPCILTSGPSARRESVVVLTRFWEAMGCHVSEMDAVAHDTVVARISHLPHAAAVLAALASFRPDPGAASFAAGGLRDTTRVASGDPGMWCEILLENRDALLPALGGLQAALHQLQEAVENQDRGTLLALLQEAQSLRATRYS